MIRDEVAMPTPMPEAAVQANSSAGKIAIAAVIAVAIGAFFYFDLGRYLSLAALKDNRDRLLSFTEGNYFISGSTVHPRLYYGDGAVIARRSRYSPWPEGFCSAVSSEPCL